MTSVERVREYSELEQEAAPHIPETEPPPHVWPDQGVIEFKVSAVFMAWLLYVKANRSSTIFSKYDH